MTVLNAPNLDSWTRLAGTPRLAHERTLIAWIRTAASLISFGFALYTFFEFEMQHQPLLREPAVSPGEFGMVMIAAGVLALVMAAIQHHRSSGEMHTAFGDHGVRVSESLSSRGCSPCSTSMPRLRWRCACDQR